MIATSGNSLGARDLYVAEVYNVVRNGTQKPYGRVFYTKGKSLIFYAYDLDQENGVKNATTFQAWGRRGPDRGRRSTSGSSTKTVFPRNAGS
jgi:hypothetical protein